MREPYHSRKACIDQLIETLKSKYLRDSAIDFKLIAEDCNINVIEIDQLFAELAGEINGTTYLFLPKYSFFRRVKEYETTHGLGHILLKRAVDFISEPTEELEADYFAAKLVNVDPDSRLFNALLELEVFLRFLRSPKAAKEYRWMARNDRLCQSVEELIKYEEATRMVFSGGGLPF